jgi:hypothetical protein
MDDYIAKPIRHQELIDTLARWVLSAAPLVPPWERGGQTRAGRAEAAQRPGPPGTRFAPAPVLAPRRNSGHR